MSRPKSSLSTKLAGPALAALMVACCLAAPLLVGAVGALTAGAVFGVAAGVVGLLALCSFVLRRAGRKKSC